MALSQLGSVPKNQLDALPLYTASQAAAGGTVSFNLGGGITRFFDGPTLGVSAAARTDQGATARERYVLVTNYIDVSGCISFACQIRRLTQGSVAVLSAATLFMQYRFSSTDTPPATPDTTSADIVVAMSILNTATTAFPNPAALALPQTVLVTWNAAQTVGAAGANVFIGSDVRLIFSWATTDPGTATFTMTLWASS
jgi:hypothetical protein